MIDSIDLDDIDNGPDSVLYNEEQKREWIKLYQETKKDVYLHNLLKCHYRLIVKIANTIKKKIGNHQQSKIDLRDLIHNGIIGLCRGVVKCELDKLGKSKSTSYLALWIKAFIYNETKFNYSEIKQPEWQIKICKDYEEQMANNDASHEKVVKNIATAHKIKISKVNKIISNRITLTSMSFVIRGSDDEKKSTIENKISDKDNYSPDSLMIFQELSTEITDLLECLNDNERFTIINRFGLYNNNPLTLKAIGDELGITKMAVSHIIKKALKKMKKYKIDEDYYGTRG